MPSARPSKSDLQEAIRAERRALAGDIEGLTEEQWPADSACAGWTVGEVANHLMVADRFPTSLGWLALPKLAAYTLAGKPGRALAPWQTKMAARGPADAARRLRENALPITARLLGRLGARLNLIEEMVHAEDIRRPLGIERRVQPASPALWEAIRLAAGMQRRKLRAPGRLRLAAPNGSIVVRKGRLFGRIDEDDGGADATVRGDPIDLLCFLVGRQVDVSFEGEGYLLQELRERRLRL